MELENTLQLIGTVQSDTMQILALLPPTRSCIIQALTRIETRLRVVHSAPRIAPASVFKV